MFLKINLENPKQKQQQCQQQQQQQCQQQQKQQQKLKQKRQIQQKEKESIMKKEEVNISSGQIGERLIVRTTTFTGQRLQYTITRPFVSSKPQSYHLKYHRKCCSTDNIFDNLSFTKDFTTNRLIASDNLTDKALQSSSSIDSCDFFDKKGSKIFTKSLPSKILSENKNKNDVKLISPEYQNHSIDRNDQNIGCYSFARRSRETQPMNFEYSKKPFDRLQSGTTSTLPSTSTINSKIITNSTNNIDKSPLPVFGKSRQQINKPVVFYEQSKSLPPLITNDKGMF
ncbi:RNA-directed RNA polymerase [Dirofilaria immitis]